ncbi:MAG TPA: hypothetical protein VKG05_02860 [Steroidobacteraceae bacterium]|nr:hypothetical protein [Steroidobacteraceae bacterium]
MRVEHHAAIGKSRGFGQLFGLEPRIAILMLVVDSMLFGGTVMTLGLLIPVSLAAGAILGFITFRAQMKWYGDDREAALIKGLIVGLLTAIPTPLPPLLYLPLGIVGLIHNRQKRPASLESRAEPGTARLTAASRSRAP